MLFGRRIWKHLQPAEKDSLFGVKEEFRKSAAKNKLSLALGEYHTEEGRPFVLSCVKKAEKTLLEEETNKSYSPISGDASFLSLSTKLTFGGSAKNAVAFQTPGGTGALRLGGELLRKFHPQAAIYASDPTWPVHGKIFAACGFAPNSYRYLDSDKNAFSFAHMAADLEEIPDGSVVLLHACAHNPTGFDPTREEWRALEEIISRKSHVPFFDMAYQGLSSGDFDADAFPVRYFAEKKNPLLVAKSFSKNMGLYGERLGTLEILCSEDETDTVRAWGEEIARKTYSNPPIHGARIARRILETLEAEWKKEVEEMSDRLRGKRKALRESLDRLSGSSHDWSYIEKQTGMFCHTGLSRRQVDLLREKHAIFLPVSGRVCIAALPEKDIARVAAGLADVADICAGL
ncbi:MAG: aspartate aminotransferase [Amphiamblys sp. WSBS2006]|nr:MAG: aspartate aminotransferase [Amphiamblys sp. WSBS2006]